MAISCRSSGMHSRTEGEYTANALEVCRALLGKGAAVDPYMQPDGTHCEACWAKQVPACMDFLFGGKYE